MRQTPSSSARRLGVRTGSTSLLCGISQEPVIYPDVFAYNASMFLMGLEASIRAGKALGNAAMVDDAMKMRETAARGYMGLWNGRFFSYGANRGSKELINDRFHQGQVGGQSLTRYCGWGDIVPMPMLDAVFTSQCKLVLSQVPDYYADKVWNLTTSSGRPCCIPPCCRVPRKSRSWKSKRRCKPVNKFPTHVGFRRNMVAMTT